MSIPVAHDVSNCDGETASTKPPLRLGDTKDLTRLRPFDIASPQEPVPWRREEQPFVFATRPRTTTLLPS
jgi:hypothetical protein